MVLHFYGFLVYRNTVSIRDNLDFWLAGLMAFWLKLGGFLVFWSMTGGSSVDTASIMGNDSNFWFAGFLAWRLTALFLVLWFAGDCSNKTDFLAFWFYGLMALLLRCCYGG